MTRFHACFLVLGCIGCAAPSAPGSVPKAPSPRTSSVVVPRFDSSVPTDASGGHTALQSRRVAGRVLGAGGAPVQIVLLHYAPWTETTVAARTTAAGDGSFDLGEVAVADEPSPSYALHATGAGLTPVSVPINMARADATGQLQLHTGPCYLRVRGAVTDERGAALRGVEVRLDDTPVVLATSDGEGHYDACVGEEKVALDFAAPGRGTVMARVSAAGVATQDVVLGPEAALEGQVVGTNRRPVAGAVVVAEPRRDGPAGPAGGYAVTDAHGRYVLHLAGAPTTSRRPSSTAAVSLPPASRR